MSSTRSAGQPNSIFSKIFSGPKKRQSPHDRENEDTEENSSSSSSSSRGHMSASVSSGMGQQKKPLFGIGGQGLSADQVLQMRNNLKKTKD